MEKSEGHGQQGERGPVVLQAGDSGPRAHFLPLISAVRKALLNLRFYTGESRTITSDSDVYADHGEAA